ncbi:MAG: hypothetical protein KKH28_14390 [Elusimicrobia bacterium]|nr:hypothetical protein [Elusimicrobiota bacterium]
MKNSVITKAARGRSILRSLPPGLLFAFFSLPLPLTSVLHAQSLPLDDKARYERSLEQKADEVILKMLGPNQAKVAVRASMDFTRTERVDVISGTAGSADKGKMFKWQSMSVEGQPFNEYLLPGFPSLEEAAAPGQTYQKQMLFPVSFIKKLTVSVIVNTNLGESEVRAVRNVVSEVLGLDAARGDELAMIKAPFAPIWKTIWYTPDALNLVFKYVILTVLGIVSMIVVSVGFLKLADAMNTMAKAQQSHQITMDMGKSMTGGGGLPGGPAGGEKPEPAGPERRESPGGGEAEGQELVFNIRPDQLDFLVNLMSGEDPSNVALVAGHLESGVRSAFLRKLPPDFSSEVISSMARVRFVETEVIMTIKEEIEKRLAGAFGGVSKVLESLSRVNLKTKKEMLEKLEMRHPEIAKNVRSKVFLAEDLLKFSERELSLLASAVKLDDWAYAIWDLSPEFKEKLRKQLTEKTWQMLEQITKYGSPSREKTDQALETIVSAAFTLIKEGKVSNPLEAPAEPMIKTAVVPAAEGA